MRNYNEIKSKLAQLSNSISKTENSLNSLREEYKKYEELLLKPLQLVDQSASTLREDENSTKIELKRSTWYNIKDDIFYYNITVIFNNNNSEKILYYKDKTMMSNDFESILDFISNIH